VHETASSSTARQCASDATRCATGSAGSDATGGATGVVEVDTTGGSVTASAAEISRDETAAAASPSEFTAAGTRRTSVGSFTARRKTACVG
jgi:hypothetical protein